MNVLLVAPDSGLAGAVAEVRQVSMSLHAVILNGYVARKDLLDALGGHVWDVIWFACHGDQNGISLSDAAVSVADLTAIARNSGAYLVFLNSCASRFVGLELHYELGIDVITTQAAADDMSAFQTGTLLARNLATGLSAKDAFERSRPGQQSQYFMFTRNVREDETELRTIQMLHEGFANLKTAIKEMEKAFNLRVDELESRLNFDIQKAAGRVDGVERSVYAMEYAAQRMPNRSSPLSDQLLVLMLALVMLGMFAFNIWNGQP